MSHDVVMQKQKLGFHEVDDLGYAAERDALQHSNLERKFVGDEIGPVLELLHRSVAGRLPPLERFVAAPKLDPFLDACRRQDEFWVASENENLGLARTQQSNDLVIEQMIDFLMTAQRAGHRLTSFSKHIAKQVVAGIRELGDNIAEHSEAPDTGLLAYQIRRDSFSFVVADHGIGIVNSLQRCKKYSDLSDYGTALHEALTEGVSRHGPNSGRGHGFDSMFRRLADLQGELRFRSGDHALEIDGTSPDLTQAKTTQKPEIDGLFISVKCRLPTQ